jgi:hypothetical protein
MDRREIRAPGRSFLQALEAAIESSRSAAVLIGKDGLGPWQTPEVEACLVGSVQSGLPVIPVLLPEAPKSPKIPFFLKTTNRVDLRGGLTVEAVDRLVWGIRGSPPDPGPPLPSSDLPVLRNLPFESLGGLFKGRGAILDWLAAEFVQEGSAKRVLIRGLGGIGKTRLAVEYAWLRGSRYIALLFVRAESPESLQSQIAALAGPDLLNLPEHEGKELALVGAVKRWLRDNPGWLMILDGIDTQPAADAVCDLLPFLVGGHILITSRISDWPPNVQESELFPISQEEAVQFLLDRTQGKREVDPDDARWAAELAGVLDALPLALEQAAAYIAHNQMTLAEYLETWQKERPKVLEWHSRRASQVRDSVAVTWQKSFQQLGPVPRALLRLTAHLAAEPIPIPMLVEGSRVVLEAAALLCAETGQETSVQPVKAALADLATYSLVTRRGRELSVVLVQREHDPRVGSLQRPSFR